MKKVKLSKKKVIISVAMVVFVAIVAAFVVNAIANYRLLSRIKSEALSANVLIITEEITTQGDNVTSVSYSGGLSGVIFRKEGSKYFVLTALHGVDTAIEQGGTIFVLGYNQPTYDKSDFSVSFTAYYAQFATGTVEYYDEKYDIAVLSFSSQNEYVSLSVSDKGMRFGERIASLSNPYQKERNAVKTGFYLRRTLIDFEAGGLEYSAIVHTAETSRGSSGGALLNTKMEIVGIIVGGDENRLGNYLRGYAIPADSLVQFARDMDSFIAKEQQKSE